MIGCQHPSTANNELETFQSHQTASRHLSATSRPPTTSAAAQHLVVNFQLTAKPQIAIGGSTTQQTHGRHAQTICPSADIATSTRPGHQGVHRPSSQSTPTSLQQPVDAQTSAAAMPAKTRNFSRLSTRQFLSYHRDIWSATTSRRLLHDPRLTVTIFERQLSCQHNKTASASNRRRRHFQTALDAAVQLQSSSNSVGNYVRTSSTTFTGDSDNFRTSSPSSAPSNRIRVEPPPPAQTNVPRRANSTQIFVKLGMQHL